MQYAEILRIAVEQSAIDLGCSPEDLLGKENRVVLSRADPRARKYLKLPFDCNLVWYGAGTVASVSPPFAEAVEHYLRAFPAEHLFETPNLHGLNDYFDRFDRRVCFMAEYFLPDPAQMKILGCRYALRLLEQDALQELYSPQWSNALCEKRRELDMLAFGAYDGEMLVGLAGASADCETMWQIGVDVLPAYRRQGIASALTAGLAAEILARGKVPFYCAAWSNLPSVRNAIRCGFRPAWAELTVKSREFTDDMNGGVRL